MKILKDGDYVISRTGHPYVKAGKRYKVRKVNASKFSKFNFNASLEDDPCEEYENSYCLFNGCAYLGGGDWEICNNPLKAFFIRFINLFKK